MNLRSLLNFLALRTDKHAQREIREIAEDMENIVVGKMPNLKDALFKLIEDKQN